MNEENETNKVSKYNSAVAQLQRIDGLWNKAHVFSSSGNYLLWNITLDKIWSELAGDLNPEDTRVKEFYNFTKRLGEAGIISKEEINGFENPKNNKAQQYMVLLQKEIWLRRLQNTQGKGTAYADEFEDDFD